MQPCLFPALLKQLRWNTLCGFHSLSRHAPNVRASTSAWLISRANRKSFAILPSFMQNNEALYFLLTSQPRQRDELWNTGFCLLQIITSFYLDNQDADTFSCCFRRIIAKSKHIVKYFLLPTAYIQLISFTDCSEKFISTLKGGKWILVFHSFPLPQSCI